MDVANSFGQQFFSNNIYFMSKAMQVARRKVTTQLIDFDKTKADTFVDFYCNMARRPFTFNNSAILPLADYGAKINLEIIYIGKVP